MQEEKEKSPRKGRIRQKEMDKRRMERMEFEEVKR